MSFTDYPPHDHEFPSPADLDVAAAVVAYDELIAAMRARDLRPRQIADLVAVLQDLARKDCSADVSVLPFVVERVPYATSAALGFAERAAKTRPEEVGAAFRAIVQGTTYHRELECLSICAAALRIPAGPIQAVSPTSGCWALEHDHPLIRARALLASALGALGLFRGRQVRSNARSSMAPVCGSRYSGSRRRTA